MDVDTPNRRGLGDDSSDLQRTRHKDDLSGEDFDLEMEGVEGRRPGREIDRKIDGIRYSEEIQLPNGHTWRRRIDGGWCRFSRRKCFPKNNTKRRQRRARRNHEIRQLDPKKFTKQEIQRIRSKVTGRKRVDGSDINEVGHSGTTSHQVPNNVIADVINNPQVVFVSKNGNLVFFKRGTIVITKLNDVSEVATAFGRGGRIPSRHVEPDKRFPAGSTGAPEPPVVLKDYIAEVSNSPYPVARIWP